MSEVTHVLDAIEAGDPQAAEKLFPLVYDELRRLAAAKLAEERPGQTLDATALVHEAFLRLVDVEKAQYFKSKGYFIGACAEAMRRILVENARRKQAVKHGGGLRRVNLDKVEVVAAAPPEDLLALDEALKRLAGHDPLCAQLVTLHCFGGLTVEQAAEAIDISRSEGYRLWIFARAWLHSQLAGGQDAVS